MKDFLRSELESSRPDIPPCDAITFCLDYLFSDKKHKITDTITDSGLTYEELLGALLLARDALASNHNKDCFEDVA